MFALSLPDVKIETISGAQDYFFEAIKTKDANGKNILSDSAKLRISEYYDNCSLLFSMTRQLFKFLEINSLPGGFNFRNCYMENSAVSKEQPPFLYDCSFPLPKDDNIQCGVCPFHADRECWFWEQGKSFPWVHFENNLYNGFGYKNYSSWYYYLKSRLTGNYATYRPSQNQIGTFIGAYSSNCYKMNGNKIVSMADIMANAEI